MSHPGPVVANLFLASKSEGFGLHFDPYCNFVFMLSGEKKWTYSSEPVTIDGGFDPGSFCASEESSVVEYKGHKIRPPRSDELNEVTMHAGDFLYIPGGVWHNVTPEADSLQCTIGLLLHGKLGKPSFRVVHHRAC